MSVARAELTANPRKTKTVRRLGSVDVAALRDGVLAIPEAVWAAENAAKPNKFEVLDTTRHIVFRFVDSRGLARFARSASLGVLARPSGAGAGPGRARLRLRAGRLSPGDAGEDAGGRRDPPAH